MGLRKQCRSRHGVHAMPSHSSADQLWNIKESMSKFFETAYKSPELTDFNLGLGIGNAIQKLTGMNSDHAEDQKKLFQLISDWRCEEWMVCLGVQHCEAMTDEACQEFNCNTMKSLITKSESAEAWLDLTTNEQMAQFQTHTLQRLCKLCKTIYQQLPHDLKCQVDTIVWCTCAMHKDLNTVKAGAKAMSEAWNHLKTMETPGPIPLPSLAKVALAKSSPTNPKKPDEPTLDAGVVKLTSLCGSSTTKMIKKDVRMHTIIGSMRSMGELIALVI